jgi:hypothetical protein
MGGESLPTTTTVMADAQFGLVRRLVPYEGFTDDYEGQPANTPIMFSEDGQALDPLAEASRPGYDPSLVRGLTVPEGARVLIWVPQIFYSDGVSNVPYTWSFWWRYRTLRDFSLNNQIPYHLAQGEGQPDTSGVSPAPRVLIPAANSGTVYVQTEPASATARVTQNGRSEDIRFGSVGLDQPLVPGGGTGVIQQGVLDPAVFPSTAGQPLYIVHEVSATGDELLIGLTRGLTPVDYEFASNDSNLSDLFGPGAQADAAVYVSIGTSP